MISAAESVIKIGKTGNEEARAFLDKWLERMKGEREKWDERAFGVRSLKDHLDT
jgi:polyhydroxyalkanoate synthesis regulator phasin